MNNKIYFHNFPKASSFNSLNKLIIKKEGGAFNNLNKSDQLIMKKEGGQVHQLEYFNKCHLYHQDVY